MKHAAFFSLCFLVCAAILPMTAKAQPGPAIYPAMYDVRNVVVDVTANDAVAARNQAFIKAQNQAFLQLMVQMQQPVDTKMPDDITLGRMVKDFELTSEHVASNRYRGNFIFRFDPAQVDTYLSVKNGVIPPTAVPILPQPPLASAQVPMPANPLPGTGVTPVAGRNIKLTILFDSLQQWRQIQAKLQQSGLISQLTIHAMQYRQAETRARLLGSLPELQARLRADGYRIEAQGPDAYVLRRDV
ncbi:MAG: hypothetical protein V4621_03675 [Pseudomonadota bacterium]